MSKRWTADQLYGCLNQPDDHDSFTLDLKQARDTRAEHLLKKPKKD